MRKVLLSITVVAMAVVLSGCGAKNAAQNGGAQNQIGQTKEEPTKTGSVIGSIKDAMGLGAKMKCNYSMKLEGSDPVKSTAYVEGKKYKSTGTFAGITSNTIFDGDTMYIWQEGQKTGMKMTMSCMEELKASLPQDQKSAPGVKSPEDQFKDATETSCSPTTESVDFSAPAGITFQDQCEMMKGLMDMKGKLPAGMPANLPNIPTQK